MTGCRPPELPASATVLNYDRSMYDAPVVLIITGILLGIIQWRAASSGARRSGAAGIRLPSTLASDEAWRAGHRAAAKHMRLAAAAFIAGGIAALIFRTSSLQEDTLMVATGVGVLFLIRAAVVANRHAYLTNAFSRRKDL